VAITFVKQTQASGSATTTQTFSNTSTTAGNLLILFEAVGSATTTAKVTNVTGGTADANGWTKVAEFIGTSTLNGLYVWMARVGTPGTANITVTFAASGASFPQHNVFEFSAGLGASTPWTVDDAQTKSNASAATIAFPTVTATGSGELLWGIASANTASANGATAGSTTGGYVWKTDAFADAMVYNLSVGPGAITPPPANNTATGTSNSIAVLFSVITSQTYQGTATLTIVPSFDGQGVITTFPTSSIVGSATLSISPAETQAAPTTLTASGTLSVSGTRQQAASTSLTTTATLSASAVDTSFATETLTATPTLSVSGVVTKLPTFTATATPTLSVNGVTTKFGSFTGTAVPTLSVAGTMTQYVTVTLIDLVTETLFGVDTQFGSINLSAVPTFSATYSYTGFSSVTLNAVPILSMSGVITQFGTFTATAVPTLTVNGTRIQFGTTSLTIVPTFDLSVVTVSVSPVAFTATPTLSVSTVQTSFGTFTGIATATFSSDAYQILVGTFTGIATPTLNVVGVPIDYATTLLTAIPTLDVVGIPIDYATTALTAVPTLSVNAYEIQYGVLSVTAVATLDVNAVVIKLPTFTGIATATFALTQAIIGVGATVFTAHPTIALAMTGDYHLTLTLSVVPELFVDIDANVFGTVPLNVVTYLNLNGVRDQPGTVTILADAVIVVAEPLRTLFGVITLEASVDLVTEAIRTAFGSSDLTILPVISLDEVVTQFPVVNFNVITQLTIAALGIDYGDTTLTAVAQFANSFIKTFTFATFTAQPTASITAVYQQFITLTLIAQAQYSTGYLRTLFGTVNMTAEAFLSIPYVVMLSFIHLIQDPEIFVELSFNEVPLPISVTYDGMTQAYHSVGEWQRSDPSLVKVSRTPGYGGYSTTRWE
jgi:hypothetical protein